MSRDVHHHIAGQPPPTAKQVICTEHAPAPVGPYSQAIRVHNLIFVSGQDPVDPATGAVPDSFSTQVRTVLTNLEGVLVAAGSGRSLIVKVTIYLSAPSRTRELNRAYESFFAGTVMPARTTICAPHLDHPLEIECIAAAIDD